MQDELLLLKQYTFKQFPPTIYKFIEIITIIPIKGNKYVILVKITKNPIKYWGFRKRDFFRNLLGGPWEAPRGRNPGNSGGAGPLIISQIGGDLRTFPGRIPENFSPGGHFLAPPGPPGVPDPQNPIFQYFQGFLSPNPPFLSIF